MQNENDEWEFDEAFEWPECDMAIDDEAFAAAIERGRSRDQAA